MTSRDAELSRLIAGRLASERRELGWSMERLADEAGVHRTSIGLIERGQRSMTLDVADRLAQSLGLRLSELLKDAERARMP
ncbi:helix-turn-helix transcriptional regulator [uncultured Nocardioides sp.]|uniref:helix-turn-helix domain-containing protein n=1 Tax=uncultured Nocardioides sp. TaxID=198441 RepID=UPI002618FF24|nr:helix-turn-helix transcriptional regulator [uncultured Nocardioides sp.]